MLSIIYNANIYYNDITINIITSNLKNEMQSLLITQHYLNSRHRRGVVTWLLECSGMHATAQGQLLGHWLITLDWQ